MFKKRVFISAAEVVVPSNLELASFSDVVRNKMDSTFQIEKESHSGIEYEWLRLNLDARNPHHPSVRDAKSMRHDVIAMSVCLGKMIEKMERGSDSSVKIDWSRVPVFMSTSHTASGMADEILEISNLVLKNLNVADGQRNQQIQSEIHPLFALRGLTNSAQAYAAQLFGFRGQNGTYGSTSHGGYLAFSDAFLGLQLGEYDCAVVGASNGGGIISLLMTAGMISMGKRFRESPCAVSLVLESEESLTRSKRKPVCEIIRARAGTNLPSFEASIQTPRYAQFVQDLGGCAIFSGGVCDEDFHQENIHVQSKWKNSSSVFPVMGHMGNASFLMNIALASHFIENRLYPFVDCLNSDVYLRESFVQLGAVI